jgi:hypothetical protein
MTELKMRSDTRAGYAVRRLKRDEVDITRDWAAAEGWNPGLHPARRRTQRPLNWSGGSG